jgi:hypothetical protein
MNEFLKEIFQSNHQLVTFIIGVVIIYIIVSFVRSVYRMVLPFVVIGLVMVVFLGHSPDEIMDKGKQLITQGSNFVQDFVPFLGKKDGELTETPPRLSPFSEEELEKFLNGEENKEKETFESNESDLDLNKF